ncbi:unnamed protein product [Schistosoma turkestanicum]|nr:unnamed protein product [Schistosoma turkestanicum]
MNKSAYTLFLIFIIYVNWTILDAKPYQLKRDASDEESVDDSSIGNNDDDHFTDYDEIRRIFQEGSINGRQSTETTSAMSTTTTTTPTPTLKPTGESDKEEIEELPEEDSDDQSPCSGGGTIFTYTIHGDDIDGDGQVEFSNHDEDNDMSGDDYDFYPMYPWFGREQFHHQRPRKPFHKPTRNTWYSRYDHFPF